MVENKAITFMLENSPFRIEGKDLAIWVTREMVDRGDGILVSLEYRRPLPPDVLLTEVLEFRSSLGLDGGVKNSTLTSFEKSKRANKLLDWGCITRSEIESLGGRIVSNDKEPS